ncbi:hypothetical protein HER32_14315 [Hymenobacter sp. BT18]|uniref:hypothetical protein n=1 Tax=Hymenobacter sp. BT18 TaxID=2835648 RepID=UPI00143E60B8|nr:hypothetical protein [Hymenobacter sp. BT18]QIX62288.1 hypothetical protein HER32_14315 [Hymenobacter sp. BT18]
MESYAEKELREAIQYLNEAREAEQAILNIYRAFEMGRPVEVTFRSGNATAVAICPRKHSDRLLDVLLEKAGERVKNLEKMEVYWARELAFEAQQKEIYTELSQNPNKSKNDLAREQAITRQRMHSVQDDDEAKAPNEAEPPRPTKKPRRGQ